MVLPDGSTETRILTSSDESALNAVWERIKLEILERTNEAEDV